MALRTLTALGLGAAAIGFLLRILYKPKHNHSESIENCVHDSKTIFKFVLTGGPCAGKTTALARLRDFFEDQGFRVFTVPEAATMLFSNGSHLGDLGVHQTQFQFQLGLIRLQLALEDNFENIARSVDQKAILICDRGTMDGSAYITSEMWNQILKEISATTVSVREGRYTAIFHMVTAASGAEQFYTLANNQIRSENVELAKDIDKRTQNAWIGHPKHFIFDNSTGFEEKINRVISTAASLAALPKITKTVFKFRLLQPPNPEDFTVSYEEFEVEKIYLRPIDANQNNGNIETEYSFVRKRSSRVQGNSVFGLTTVRRLSNGQRVELKRIIGEREYTNLVKRNKDPDRIIVLQKRISFLYENHSFIIHTYLSPKADLSILHCMSDTEAQIKFPPFLSVGESVFDDGNFSAWQISKKSA